MTSTVKVIATRAQQAKVLSAAHEIQHKISEFNWTDYEVIRSAFFGGKKTIDKEKLNKVDDDFVFTVYHFSLPAYHPVIHTTVLGDAVIRLNNLIISGNELQLTAEDSKAFDLVCGGVE